MISDPHGPLYSVVCTDTNPYGTWQVEFLEHTWQQAEMPGELIRLVGCPNDEELPHHDIARVIRTSARNTHPLTDVDYAGFNRLFSLNEWLERERPVGSVLILDSDFAFRSAINLRAEPGQIIAQKWMDFGVGGNVETAINRVTDEAGPFDPVTWPMILHTSDLRRMMPRWLEITALIKQQIPAFWEVDMFAFVVVLREFGLKIQYETLGAWMPWPEEFVRGAPIIHYCQKVRDNAGEVLWYKQDYKPWEPVDYDPDDADKDYCRDLLRMFKDYVALRRNEAPSG